MDLLLFYVNLKFYGANSTMYNGPTLAAPVSDLSHPLECTICSIQMQKRLAIDECSKSVAT